MPPPITLTQHRGLMRKAVSPFMEKSDPSFAYIASDVVFDYDGNVYSAWGFKALGTSVFSNANNVSWIGFSFTFDVILALEGTTLRVINPTTGAQITSFASAFVSGSILTMQDWSRTNACYLSDGTSYKKLTNNATTLTDLTGSVPLGAGKILFVWKDQMWSSEPTGFTCQVIPSSVGDPETFNSTNGIRITEDGPGFNALSGGDGAMFIHKNEQIWCLTGTSPAAGDLNLRPLKCGGGALSKTAIFTWEGIDYLIARDGFFRFNGQRRQALHTNISTLFLSLFNNNLSSSATGVSLDSTKLNYVFPIISLWNPDFGKRYLHFVVSVSTGLTKTFSLDMDSLEWTTRYESNPFLVFKAYAYSPTHITTYLVYTGNTSVCVYTNSDKYDTSTITGVYATQQIDAGSRGLEKNWQLGIQYPVQTDAYIFLDLNGANNYGFNVTNSGAIISEPNNQTGLVLPKEANAFCCSFKFTQVGGLKPMTAGMYVYYEVEEPRADRSFTISFANTILGLGSTVNGGGSSSSLGAFNGFYLAGNGV